MSQVSEEGESLPPDLEATMVDFETEREHPQDWTASHKWCTIISVTLPLFLMPLSSTIVSPAATAIVSELKSTSKIAGPLLLSLFLLTYSLGPLLLGPLSEIFGRRPVLQGGSLLYLIFNISCGFSRTMPQLLVFRLLSGLGAGASLAVSS